MIQSNYFGFIKDVVFLMHKCNLITLITGLETRYFLNSYFDWKRIVKSRIAASGNNAWTKYGSVHQDIEILNKIFSCMTNNQFRKIVDRTSDLAFKKICKYG